MDLVFVVQQWAIWPPMQQDKTQDEIFQAKLLARIPPMLKRRLSPLARTVFCAAIQCMTEQDCIPTVFSSSHGELAKSFAMLEQIEAGEDISPTMFSLSVHNAIAGMFSIVFHNQMQTTVVAPGEDGLAPAFIEALGLLNEGADEVLLIFYDEPLVPFYPAEPFKLTTDTRLALALKLTQRGQGEYIQLTKTNLVAQGVEQPLQVPLFADFLNTNQRVLEFNTPRHGWCWRKYD
jgi:beta-ketoacyl synthase-like protein